MYGRRTFKSFIHSFYQNGLVVFNVFNNCRNPTVFFFHNFKRFWAEEVAYGILIFHMTCVIKIGSYFIAFCLFITMREVRITVLTTSLLWLPTLSFLRKDFVQIACKTSWHVVLISGALDYVYKVTDVCFKGCYERVLLYISMQSNVDCW